MTERGQANAEGAGRVGAALAGADAVCALLDESGTLVWANAAAAAATGRPNEETYGIHAAEFFAERDHERVASGVARVAEEGYAQLKAELVTADGERVPYEFLGTRTGDAETLVFGLPASVDDDIEAGQAILERMAEGFLALTGEGEITYLNDRAHALLAAVGGEKTPADRTDIYGRPVWELLPDAIVEKLRQRHEQAMDSQEPTSFELHRVATDRFFEGDLYPAEGGVSVYVREVTEQRRATRQRRRSERALRELYQVSADPELDFEAKLEHLLDVGCERLDLPLAFLNRIEGDTQTVVASRGGHPGLEAGDSCPLDEAYCRHTLEAENSMVVSDALGDGWAGDPAYERFGLGAYVGVNVVVADELYGTLCFAAEEPRPNGFDDEERTFVEFLSQWVRYELERRRDEAALRRQNERLEEFASIVSHDLRNPLNVASGNVELAKETGEAERLDTALDALERADQLVGDVLALARQGRVVDDPEPVDLAAVATDAWAAVAAEHGTLDVAGESTLRADRSRLQSLFENLFRNAVEHGSTANRNAQRSEDSVEHGSTNSRPSAGDAAGHSPTDHQTESDDAVEHGSTGSQTQSDDAVEHGAPEGDGTVHIEVGALPDGFYVADDGVGIAAENAGKVFDHGFTTDEGGTGLGLSIVRRIAEAHDWRVELADAEGARFEFHDVSKV